MKSNALSLRLRTSEDVHSPHDCTASYWISYTMQLKKKTFKVKLLQITKEQIRYSVFVSCLYRTWLTI